VQFIASQAVAAVMERTFIDSHLPAVLMEGCKALVAPVNHITGPSSSRRGMICWRNTLKQNTKANFIFFTKYRYVFFVI